MQAQHRTAQLLAGLDIMLAASRGTRAPTGTKTRNHVRLTLTITPSHLSSRRPSPQFHRQSHNNQWYPQLCRRAQLQQLKLHSPIQQLVPAQVPVPAPV